MKMTIKQCPNCKNKIRIHEVKFPVINDYGGIVVECESCLRISYMDIINPEESVISKGAKKVDTWDNEGIGKEVILKKYDRDRDKAKELKFGLVVVGDFESREYSFDFNETHIYFCSDCGEEVETVSNEELNNNYNEISSAFNNLMNYILANHRWQRDSLVIELKSKCKCGKEFTSFWHSEFKAKGKSINLDTDFFLIGTDMPLKSALIDGIMSKNNCKTILEKFIIRWNAIFSRLLIVTPFVGHQWLSQAEVIELWDWIKNFLDPNKSTLVTRTATFNKYKKACEEKGVSIDLLENFGLNNQIIQDFTRKQDFHAKVYVGYSSDRSEILMGSFNLMNGPSVENIAFKSCDYNNFLKRFVLPMKISIDPPNILSGLWSHIKQDKDGKWISNEVKCQDILSKIMRYD